MDVTTTVLLLYVCLIANCQGNETVIKSSVNKSGVIQGCFGSSPEGCSYKFQREEDHSLFLSIKSEKLLHGDNVKNINCDDTNRLEVDGGRIVCNISTNNFTEYYGFRSNTADCVSLCDAYRCEENERIVSLRFTHSTSKASVVLWRYTVNFQYVRCSAGRHTTSNHKTRHNTAKQKSTANVTSEHHSNGLGIQTSTDEGFGQSHGFESTSSALLKYLLPVTAAVIIVAGLAAVIYMRNRREGIKNSSSNKRNGENLDELSVGVVNAVYRTTLPQLPLDDDGYIVPTATVQNPDSQYESIETPGHPIYYEVPSGQILPDSPATAMPQNIIASEEGEEVVETPGFCGAVNEDSTRFSCKNFDEDYDVIKYEN